MKNTVKKYIESGLKCLPTKEDKAPDVKTTWKDGINDVSLYTYGVGVICGEKSGYVECLDFDNHFDDAKQTITDFMLMSEIKALFDKYKFVVEKTVSGGYHLIYKCNDLRGNTKLAQKPRWDETHKIFKPDCIIETRGEGGYFVAAPTQGYEIIKGDILQIPTIEKDERDIIISCCKSLNEWKEVIKNSFEQSDRVGDKYNEDSASIGDAKNLLFANGWKETKKGYLTRPGKDNGISGTFGKVAENIFYCFTSNGYPFEPEKAYTPFQIKGLLEYNKDFSKLAKDLAERYGEKPKIKEKPKVDLYEKLKKSIIDLSTTVEKPPTILSIRDEVGTSTMDKRLFTLGNFSCLTGKAKAKKTFLSVLLNASLVKNNIMQNKLVANMPNNRRTVLIFDTEQSEYDAYNTGKRVSKLGGSENNFFVFSLREYSPMERCELIEYALDKFKNESCYAMIDGIADLSNGINDEEEASRVVGLLLKWTKIYNTHICTIIHQNKNDNYATGHLGSSILKKAEIIIAVRKQDDTSIVENERGRGIDFDSFAFEITDEGLPRIVNNVRIEKLEDVNF